MYEKTMKLFYYDWYGIFNALRKNYEITELYIPGTHKYVFLEIIFQDYVLLPKQFIIVL